jgi:hypothetical protein
MATVVNGDSSFQIPLKTDYPSIAGVAFRALKIYWKVLIVITIINTAFLYLLTLTNYFVIDPDNPSIIMNYGNPGWFILYVLLFLLVYMIISIMLNYGYALATLKAARNEQPTIPDLLRPFKKFFTVIFSGILLSIIVGLGLIFFIIPGLYLLIRLIFVPYLVVDWSAGVIEAIEESWKITKGHFWDIFLMGFVNFLLTLVISALSFLFVFLITGSILKTNWITQIITCVIGIPLEMYTFLTIGAMYNAIRGKRISLETVNQTTQPPVESGSV